LQGVRMPALGKEYIIVEYQAFDIGQEILFSHQVPYWRMLITARLAMLIFPAAALFFVYRLGRYLINPLGATLATVLFSFDPTFLGQAPWLGTDVAGCATILAGLYFGIRWIARPSWRRTAALGIALAVAIGTKYSGTLLLAALPLIAIARILMARCPRRMLPRVLPNPWKVMFLFFLMFIALWAIFLFDVAPLRFNALKFERTSSIYPR